MSQNGESMPETSQFNPTGRPANFETGDQVFCIDEGKWE